MKISFLTLVILLSSCAGPQRRPTPTATPTPPTASEQRTNFVLTTANGYGSALFDAKQGQLSAFFDHPYRFVRAAKDPTQTGVERRNLLLELSVDGAGAPSGEASYAQETNIIQSHTPESDHFFFEPFGLAGNVLVALTHATSEGEALHRLHFNLGEPPVAKHFWETPLQAAPRGGQRLARRGEAWVQTGDGRGALIYLPLNPAKGHCEPACSGRDIALSFRGPRIEQWSGVLVAYVDDAASVPKEIVKLQKWLAARHPKAVLNAAQGEWTAWRKAPSVEFKSEDERKLWRQSETVLRMGQVLEPGPGHGQILASLAPGEWSVTWVRDASYSIVALARMGHWAEAKLGLEFLLNADPVGLNKSYVDNVDYRISVTRYYGDGAEEADFSEQPTPNVELDDWGLALWAARQYVEASGDLGWLKSPTRKGSVYEALQSGVADALAKQIEKAPRIVRKDSSIWEVHQQNAHHFLFTSLIAARGFCDFTWLAAKTEHGEDVKRFAQIDKEVRYDLPEAFLAPEGFLLGAIERSPHFDNDAAAVELFNMDILGKTAVAERSFAHLQELKLPNGGYKRVAEGGPYDLNEWVFVDYRMATAYFRRGDVAAGQALLDRLTERARLNFYLLPEEYSALPNGKPLGAYMGSAPMVGYGAGVQILSFLQRAGQHEPQLCGFEAERS